ncbi:MAG: FtsX-like permease family protein [Bacteroidetes bacterium]|nr:FtsX-like permease family protein [Bacteroidota bacterium]
MDFSLFVGKRLAFSNHRSFTTVIIRLAIAGIGISLTVMLLAVGIVKGFQNQIREKVVGFEGHIQIRKLDMNQSSELAMIDKDSVFSNAVLKIRGVSRINAFCNKTGIINTGSEIEGMLFKGVPSDYNWQFLTSYLKRGRLPVFSDTADTYELMLSSAIADRIRVDTGQKIDVFFIHDGKVRQRRFKLVGIFNTGLGEFDRTVCFTDIRVIQRIYATDYSQVSGYEVYIDDLTKLNSLSEKVDEQIPINLRAERVDDLHPVIFQWLEIVDSNAVIIIVLMTIVAVINLITAFLILILNRTRMIGILKSLGAANRQVVGIFLVNGLMMIIPGLLIGNVLGLGLARLQQHFGIFTLPEETYYMSVVPVEISLHDILFLNIGTLIICFLMLLIPALLVRRITPVRAIRFN